MSRLGASVPRRVVHTIGPLSERGGANATSSASANTKGSWTQAIASTAAETHFIQVHGSAVSAGVGALLDVGVGGAGAEVVVVSNLLIGASARANGGSATGIAAQYNIPIRIPKGSRIAFRNQATTGSTLSRNFASLFSAPVGEHPSTPSGVVTLGVDTATSRGVAVTADNTWVEVVSSTTVPFAGVIPMLQPNDTTTLNSAEELVVGIGASGSEVAIGAVTFACTAGGLLLGAACLPIWHHIPAGSRIAVRSPNATTTNLDAAVLGIPYT
jgi:hypothetical protein